MLFGQLVHSLNFSYPDALALVGTSARLTGKGVGAGVGCEQITPAITKLSIHSDGVGERPNTSDGVRPELRTGTTLTPQGTGPVRWEAASCAVELAADRLSLEFGDGLCLAGSQPGLGFLGEKGQLSFDLEAGDAFYGFGECTKRLNKRGDMLDFYTIDVVAVLGDSASTNHYNPTYVSIPLVILRRDGRYAALYVDNPRHLVMSVGARPNTALQIQSLDGHNELYLIAGPTLADVVRNFGTLTGRHEVPPVWSLGYHQCRWGYKCEQDLQLLAEHFAKHDVPVGTLWYDIDYMDGYRVFTWDRVDFPDPARLNRELKDQGIRTVTIVDPGVKLDPGYPAYDSGKAADIYCQTPDGKDYVGQVWPGLTVFPDFTTDKGRDWWATQLADFVRDSALDGVWLDMNDPATGYIAVDDMCFDGGKVDHMAYHNQYGHFMAKASQEAFRRLDPEQRPFILTRSGATGTQRYSAIWTGDNCANWQHLAMSIPETLNLGLSGVAFNGPDVAGFMGDTNPKLMVRWFQAGFLFPFFRNHSCMNTKTQEPWEFGDKVLAQVRDTIVTRYRLLPYLYSLFHEHYRYGDPILRPLLYHFDDPAFVDTDDQYLVGDALMAAPFVTPEDRRYIVLPEGWWYDLQRGEWLAGGRIVAYSGGLDTCPLFARDGAIIPWYNGKLANSDTAWDLIELHCFCREQSGRRTLVVDDGSTRAYQHGQADTWTFEAKRDGGELSLTGTVAGDAGEGPSFEPVVYGATGPITANLELPDRSESRQLAPATRRWVGRDLPVLA